MRRIKMEEKVYDSQKFMRGQVWSTKKVNNTTNRLGFNSSINTFGHPVIILSSNVGNATSNLVTCASFTSTNNDLSTNLKIKCPDGVIRSVICSQIFNMDKSDLVYYMYSVTDIVVEAILDKFNKSCDYMPKVHCSVSLSDIRDVVERIATAKYNQLIAEQDSNKIVADVARSLEQTYTKLKDNYNDALIKQSLAVTDNAPVMSTITDVDDRGVIDYSKHVDGEGESKRGAISYTPKPKTDDSENINKPDVKQLRQFNCGWTDELRQQFMKEKDELDAETWAYRFGFESVKQAKKSFYNMRWMLKNK